MREKSVAFVNEEGVVGSPIHARISAFSRFFSSEGFSRSVAKPRYIFFSMPPFRNFSLFFRRGVILDIRDGWSIAQSSGYGGTRKRQPIKAWVARRVERFIIRRSFLTITCTPGLQCYLETLSGKAVLLIPNGISDARYELAHKVRKSSADRGRVDSSLVFVCAGKFSEYGRDKVKRILNVIVNRYSSQQLKVLLVGSELEANHWVIRFFSDISGGRGSVDVLPRVNNDEELYNVMAQADYGLALLRDPDYEFGTKVYDYIAVGLPVVNYFDSPNSFTDYFDACLDVSFDRNRIVPEIRRSVLVEKGLRHVQFE